MKHFRFSSLLPYLSGGLLGLLIFLMIRLMSGASVPQDELASIDIDVPDVRTYTKCDTIHRGETLGGVLLRNRMTMQEIDRIIREIRQHEYFSLRSVMPGQVIELTRNEAGKVINLACKVAPQEVYVFEIDAVVDTVRSYAQAIESEIRIRKLAGPVRSTFEQAILAAGGQPRLASKVADILQGDIDFFTEVRKGDEFCLLIEERYVEGSFIDYGEILYGWYRGEKANASCVYFETAEGQGGYYDNDGGSLKRRFLKSPLNYRRISSHFAKSRFHPILKRYRPHHGVDYAAPTGTPIASVADGVIRFAGWKGGYGRLVEIRHSPTHSTRYGHLRGFAKGIKKGVRVNQGQTIGFVGRSGMATGPHLHYEMRVNGTPINPLTMRMIPTEPIPPERLDDFIAHASSLTASEQLMAAGTLLESEEWQGMLLAQNATRTSTTTSD